MILNVGAALQFLLSWFDKTISGTYSFVSVIENFVPWFATLVETITQFTDQVKIKSILQLNKGI